MNFDRIAERITPEELARAVGAELGRNEKCRCPMPGHEDRTPSCQITRYEGRTVATCFGACGRTWTAVRFAAQALGVTEQEAARRLAHRACLAVPERQTPPPPIDPAIVEAAHEALLRDLDRLAYLTDDRMLSMEIVREFKLGFYEGRYTIPIPDENGEWRNIRMYDPHASGNKMRSWRGGYGQAKLFPLPQLLDAQPGDEVYLFEGEWDCLLARSRGLEAFASTGGARHWRETWSVLFVDLDVVVDYDADEAGRRGARAVAESLLRARP